MTKARQMRSPAERSVDFSAHTVSEYVFLRVLYPQFKQSSDIKRYETRTRNAKSSFSTIVQYSRQVQAQRWRKRDNWVPRAERSVDFSLGEGTLRSRKTCTEWRHYIIIYACAAVVYIWKLLVYYTIWKLWWYRANRDFSSFCGFWFFGWHT